MARLCREVDSKATKAVVVETCEWNKILIDSGFLFLISLLTQLKLTDLERGLKTIDFQICNAFANWRWSVCFAAFQKSQLACFAVCAAAKRHYNINIHTTLWSTSWEVVSDHIFWTKRQMKISLTVSESPWPREQDSWIVSTPPWRTSCSQAEIMSWTYVSVGNPSWWYLLLGTFILNYALAPVVWIIRNLCILKLSIIHSLACALSKLVWSNIFVNQYSSIVGRTLHQIIAAACFDLDNTSRRGGTPPGLNNYVWVIRTRYVRAPSEKQQEDQPAWYSPWNSRLRRLCWKESARIRRILLAHIVAAWSRRIEPQTRNMIIHFFFLFYYH